MRIDKTKTLEYVQVFLDYSHNSGNCLFDNVRLVNTLATSAVYNEGIIESIAVFGKTQLIKERVTSHDGIYTSVTEKNENYDVVRQTLTDRDGNSFVSVTEYDDCHRPVRSQNYRGIMTEYSYNSVGMPTLTKSYYYATLNPDVTSASFAVPVQCFMSETVYDTTGEFAVSVSDERDENIKAQSSYNTVKGLLNSSVTPNGQTTNYTYNADNDLVTGVSATVGNDTYSVLYGYTNRRLTAITHNGFNYGFTYDGMGRAKKVMIAGVDYTENNYTLTETTTVETTYAGGEKMKVETDRHSQPIKRTYTDKDGDSTVIAEGEYDSLGKPVEILDNITNKCYTYLYDAVENVTEEKINGTTFKEYEYDEHNRLTKTTFHVGGDEREYSPIYDKNANDKIYADNAVVGVKLNGVFTAKAEHDSYGRVTQKNFTLNNAETPLLSDEFTYISSTARLTNMISTVTQKLNGVTQGTFSYSYDNNGNITEIQKNSVTIAKYAYDDMNQLVREDNSLTNKSYTFDYDTSGNLLEKKEYAYTAGTLGAATDTKVYTYAATGWRDQLTSFGGQTITYDALGNPTTYRGHDLSWGKIRQLESFDSHTFAYDASGIRTHKNNITYTLDGTTILSEARPTGTINYLYGDNGVAGFTYNNATYYYEKNLQGDITAIYDTAGNKKAAYIYDAWGNHTVTLNTDGIGSLNPFRYRGYYYDTEINLYYLQSRYYDSEWGCYINPDSTDYLDTESVNGLNLYAYCGNDQVNKVDPSGHSAIIIGLLIGAFIGAGLGFGTVAYNDYKDDSQIFNASIGWEQYVGGTIVGGILGAACGGIVGTGGIYLSGAVTSTFGKLTTDLFAYTLTGAPMGTWEDYAIAFAFGGLTAGLGKGVKTALDVFVRPALTQGAKIELGRQATFNWEKYGYDVATRAITSGMKSPWKSFARGGIKGYWYLCKNGFFIGNQNYQLSY